MSRPSMLADWLSKMSEWRRRESGFSEIYSTIIVLPIIAYAIFALIETGINLQYRAQVENITQLTTRSIALDGAQYWARTTAVPDGYSSGSFLWEDYGADQLAKLCGDTGNRCNGVPTMECEVENAFDGATFRQLAQFKGSEVTCFANFPYVPVSPLSRNPVTSLGLSGFFASPIRAEVTALTTVGGNG